MSGGAAEDPEGRGAENLGRYRFLRRLRSGDEGRELIEVRDLEIGRTVLARTLPRGASRGAVERFVREARVTGQLEHPNIVPVHELDVAPDDRVYFTMKRVDGESLEEALGRVRRGERDAPSRRRLLQVFLNLCDAVSFAHARGVVHCDLHPASVMIGHFGEVQLVGWEWAAVGGRPTADSDPRTDVHALGAILYRILTLEAPFDDGAGRKGGDGGPRPLPVAPSRRAPGRRIPWELEAATLRALEPRRARRYQTVEALASDVDAYLGGGFLEAVRYGPVARALKWARRHRSVCLAAAFVVLAVAAAFGLIRWREHAAIPDLMARARRAAGDGDIEKAQEFYVRVLQIDSGHEEALEGRRGVRESRRIHDLEEDRRERIALDLGRSRRHLRDLAGLADLERRGKRPWSIVAEQAAVLSRLRKGVAALERVLAGEREQVEARRTLPRALEMLGVAARAGGDFTLARLAFARLRALGAPPGLVQRRLKEVEEVATRGKRHVRARLEKILAELGGARGVDERTLEDRVYEASGYRDMVTVEVLARRLRPLIARARQLEKEHTERLARDRTSGRGIDRRGEAT